MLCLSSKSTYLGVIVRIVPLRGSHHPSYLPSPTWTQGDCAFEFPSESANESSLVAGPEKEMAFGFGKAAKEPKRAPMTLQDIKDKVDKHKALNQIWFKKFPLFGFAFFLLVVPIFGTRFGSRVFGFVLIL